MKERIVIEDFVCNDNCKRKDCEVCFKEKSKKEQVPETWEELKELCKGVKDVEVYDDTIYITDQKVILVRLFDDGEIKDSGKEVIAENRIRHRMMYLCIMFIFE